VAVLGVGVAVAAAVLLLGGRSAVTVRVAQVEVTGGAGVPAGGISANGYVVARTKASVSAKIPGQLEYLGVSEGSRVQAGDILARIESRDYEARLAAAQAEVARIEAALAQARRDLERTRAMQAKGLFPDVDLESAATAVDVLVAELDAARAESKVAEVNLENTRVRAPFDGTVLRKDAEVGEYVAPQSAGGGFTRTAIVTMADLSTLEVEVDVSESYIARIASDQPVRIILDAYPDVAFRGSVRQVVPTADRQKATVQVKVSILDADPRILPEMGAKAVFVRDGDGAAATGVASRRVLVPKDALVTSSEGQHVWVVAGERAERRNVVPGDEQDGKLTIQSGLQGGETIILSPPADLQPGARVRPAAGS
jgi:RND family efflux transporter MFP subunit